MKLITLIILFLTSTHLFGKDVRLIEKELLKDFRKIAYWRDFRTENSNVNLLDSLSNANENFNTRLLYYTSHEPSTLTYSFPKLSKEGLIITTSKDTRFKIYSWDTEEGGTMRFFQNVFQFKSGDRVLSKNPGEKLEDGDPGGFYSGIFQIKTPKSSYYLACYNSIYSTKDCYQGLKAFAIEASILNSRAKIIKTQTGIKDKIGFYFDFFSVVDRKERPLRLITFDEQEKLFKLPVVWDNGIVTDKQIIYKFNGNFFEKTKNASL